MIVEIMLIVCSIWSLLCGILLIAIYINNKRDKKRVKDNTKEENLKSPCYQKTSCLDCKMYDKENYYCPRFCEVIRDAVKDAKQSNYDEENIQDVLEQIKEIRKETTKDGEVFTVLEKYR